MEYPKDDSSPIARDLRGGRRIRWDAVWARKKGKKGVEDDGGVAVSPDHLVIGIGSSTSEFGESPGADWRRGVTTISTPWRGFWIRQ